LTNDHGLGSTTHRITHGKRFKSTTPGDIVQLGGLFKTPSVRNPDKRPAPTFVTALLHNGVFRSVPEVVPFNNKWNLAEDANGNKVAFDLRNGPPASTTSLLPPPEDDQTRSSMVATSVTTRSPRGLKRS
jgi:hypothetical protein